MNYFYNLLADSYQLKLFRGQLALDLLGLFSIFRGSADNIVEIFLCVLSFLQFLVLS